MPQNTLLIWAGRPKIGMPPRLIARHEICNIIRQAFFNINKLKEQAMKKFYLLVTVLFASFSPSAWADNDDTFKAKLEGYQEVPAVSSPGSGKFKAMLTADGNLQYELTYQDLQGTPFMSHIHFGNRNTNGDVMLWLCGNAPATPPAGTPACPVPSGTVTGTLTSAQVISSTRQLIAAGELAEVINALKSGAGYVNVHSNLAPGGEIRGQVKSNHD
jgi:hypothetical protein